MDEEQKKLEYVKSIPVKNLYEKVNGEELIVYPQTRIDAVLTENGESLEEYIAKVVEAKVKEAVANMEPSSDSSTGSINFEYAYANFPDGINSPEELINWLKKNNKQNDDDIWTAWINVDTNNPMIWKRHKNPADETSYIYEFVGRASSDGIDGYQQENIYYYCSKSRAESIVKKQTKEELKVTTPTVYDNFKKRNKDAADPPFQTSGYIPEPKGEEDERTEGWYKNITFPIDKDCVVYKAFRIKEGNTWQSFSWPCVEGDGDLPETFIPVDIYTATVSDSVPSTPANTLLLQLIDGSYSLGLVDFNSDLFWKNSISELKESENKIIWQSIGYFSDITGKLLPNRTWGTPVRLSGMPGKDAKFTEYMFTRTQGYSNIPSLNSLWDEKIKFPDEPITTNAGLWFPTISELDKYKEDRPILWYTQRTYDGTGNWINAGDTHGWCAPSLHDGKDGEPGLNGIDAVTKSLDFENNLDYIYYSIKDGLIEVYVDEDGVSTGDFIFTNQEKTLDIDQVLVNAKYQTGANLNFQDKEDYRTILETNSNSVTSTAKFGDYWIVNFTVTKKESKVHLEINSAKTTETPINGAIKNRIIKIPITVKNEASNIECSCIFKVIAICDVDNNGIWRYQVTPSFPLLVKKTSGSVGNTTVEYINTLNFSIEITKDSLGNSPQKLDESDEYIVRILLANKAPIYTSNSTTGGNNNLEAINSNIALAIKDNISKIFNCGGIIILLFVKDKDYLVFEGIGNGFCLVDTESVVAIEQYTVDGKEGPAGGTSYIDKSVYLGQVPRTRVWNDCPDDTIFIAQSKTGEIEDGQSYNEDDVITVGNKHYARFYDLVYYYSGNDRKVAPYLYLCKKTHKKGDKPAPPDAVNSECWIKSQHYDFLTATTAAIEDLIAKNVTTNSLYVTDSENGSVVAGMINGYDKVIGSNKTPGDVRIFAGGDDPENAAFKVDKNGILTSEKGTFKGDVKAKSLSVTDDFGQARFKIEYFEEGKLSLYGQEGSATPLPAGTYLGMFMGIDNNGKEIWNYLPYTSFLSLNSTNTIIWKPVNYRIVESADSGNVSIYNRTYYKKSGDNKIYINDSGILVNNGYMLIFLEAIPIFVTESPSARSIYAILAPLYEIHKILNGEILETSENNVTLVGYKLIEETKDICEYSIDPEKSTVSPNNKSWESWASNRGTGVECVFIKDNYKGFNVNNADLIPGIGYHSIKLW